MFVIVGLGNPGTQYAHTRHNVGFKAVEAIAAKKGVTFDRLEKHGLTAVYRENGQKVMLVKPQTYMNNSGECVRAIMDYYDVPTENLLVIYDDIDLPLGQTRIRKKGGAGTHNGMRSIIAELGNGAFPRMRFGIGPQPEFYDLAAFVLSVMNDAQREKVAEMCESAVKCADYLTGDGIDMAMNRLNVRPQKKPKSETGLSDLSEKTETPSAESDKPFSEGAAEMA